MDGIIGDDDNDLDDLDDLERDAPEDDEPPVVTTDASASDAADDVTDLNDVGLADFALLPHVAELVAAHRSGDAQAAERKMIALRRAARRAETRYAALQLAVTGESAAPDAARQLLDARSELLARMQTKLASRG
jgi:hypothetical protein